MVNGIWDTGTLHVLKGVCIDWYRSCTLHVYWLLMFDFFEFFFFADGVIVKKKSETNRLQCTCVFVHKC